MSRLVISVAGVVVDAMNTLIAQNRKGVQKKLGAAAKKLRTVVRAEPRKEKGWSPGPTERLSKLMPA